MERNQPSDESWKNFVCKILPGIMLDLKKKGKLPSEYITEKKDKPA